MVQEAVASKAFGAGRERSGVRLAPGALAAPASIFVALGLLVPIAVLFRYSFNQFVPGQFMVDALTVENYVKFFTDSYYTAILWRTFRVAVICTGICLVLGFPLAYVLARMRSGHKNFIIMLVVLPLFVGNAVRAAGWMTLLSRKGFINTVLMALGITGQPLELMYTEGAVIAGIITINLPFMVLTLQAVIEGIDRAVEEAAQSLGAGPLATFRRVIWPLALPGTLAGTILTFILAMNAYATPVLLGGPKFAMMAPLVYNQFAGQNNWPFGGAIAFVLMTATILLTLTANILVQRRYRR
ncbi:MAG: ABC transporter permease [Proteobacteria bacterium]|nr:ABC transporter permease [Pseudomonadota bacterium]